MNSTYYVYIVQCADNTFYIGKTKDLSKRIQEHNGNLPKGAKYTRSRRPVTLVYSETCNTSSEALIREFELKKLTRTQKEALITTFQEEQKR